MQKRYVIYFICLAMLMATLSACGSAASPNGTATETPTQLAASPTPNAIKEENNVSDNTFSLVTFQVHQEEFEFLGIENVVTESSNFGLIWDNFFKLGGYDNIVPYAADDLDTNVWYTNDAGEKIFFQGRMVKNVDNVAKRYTLKKFPASDYLVLTHTWCSTFNEAQRKGIGFGHSHIDTVQLPDGYVRDESAAELERDICEAPEGSRIEWWLPIKRISE